MGTQTKEFINALVVEESKHRNSVEIRISDIYTMHRGIFGGTWMTPLLFIDFAMWLNPTFKVQVLKFVYDELIRYRNEAGDAYFEIHEIISFTAYFDSVLKKKHVRCRPKNLGNMIREIRVVKKQMKKNNLTICFSRGYKS